MKARVIQGADLFAGMGATQRDAVHVLRQLVLDHEREHDHGAREGGAVGAGAQGQGASTMTEREYASPLVATCRHCGAAPGEDCQTWLSGGYVKTRSHYSRWRDAQGVEIAALRALLQEATEGRECFEHQHPEDVHEQATCSCGAAICPEPATCLLGRADRLLGHTTHGECITFVCDGVAR